MEVIALQLIDVTSSMVMCVSSDSIYTPILSYNSEKDKLVWSHCVHYQWGFVIQGNVIPNATVGKMADKPSAQRDF